MNWHDLTHKHFTLTRGRDNIIIEFCYTRFLSRVKGIAVYVDGSVWMLADIKAERFLMHLGTAMESKTDIDKPFLNAMMRHVEDRIPCGVCA